MVSCMFQSDLEDSSEISSGLTIFHLVCIFDQINVMKFFLRYGIAVMSKISSLSKQSLIHVCAWFGSQTCLSLLMRNGLSIEDKNELGMVT